MENLVCSACGAELSPEWVVCPVCAKPVSNSQLAGIFCTQCKGRISADTQICPYCRVPIIRRYCSGCDSLVPDQTAACPHCETPATAKRSLIKRFWKSAAAIVASALVVATIQFIRGDRQNEKNSVAVQPATVQEKTDAVPPFILALKPAPQPAKEEPKPSKVLEIPAPDPLPPAPQEEVTAVKVSTPAVVEAAPAVAKANPAVPIDLVTEGSRLNDGRKLADIGSRLLEHRRYSEAVSVLRNAVETFPPGTRDLSYGLALYKLGNALRLGGQPEEAIPVLQRAMEFAWIRTQASREMRAASVQAEKSNIASRH